MRRHSAPTSSVTNDKNKHVHERPLSMVGTRERGHVASVRDSYGFVSNHIWGDQLFFHVSEYIGEEKSGDRPDLTGFLKTGDIVEYTVGPAYAGKGGFSAKQVFRVVNQDAPLANPDKLSAQLQAANLEKKDLQIRRTSYDASLSQSNVFAQDIMKRRNSLPGNQANKVVRPPMGTIGDGRGESPLRGAVGSAPGLVNTSQNLIPYPSVDDLRNKEAGVVAMIQGSSGVVKSKNEDRKIPFNFTDVKSPIELLEVGSPVLFKVTHNVIYDLDVATEIVLVPKIPQKPSRDEFQVIARKQGFIVKEPSSPDQDDGIVCFIDVAGDQQHCAYNVLEFIARDDQTGIQLEAGDQIDFELSISKHSGMKMALNIKLLCTADERREVGRVSQLQDTFGFINCSERYEKLFFHRIAGGLDGQTILDLREGDEVEFTVQVDAVTSNSIATGITRVPEGASSIPRLPEDTYQGVVQQKCLPPRANLPGTAGIVLMNRGLDASQELLVFTAADLVDIGLYPMEGDGVIFKIATPKPSPTSLSKYVARRATQVQMSVLYGAVVNTKNTFGFIEYKSDVGNEGGDQNRIFYHHSEIVDKDIQLNPGDKVSFVKVINLKTGEPNARKIKLLERGPGTMPSVQSSSSSASMPIMPPMLMKQDSMEKNPNAPKFQTHPQQLSAARISKGPDGTKGFTAFGRGKPPTPPPRMAQPNLTPSFLRTTPASFVGDRHPLINPYRSDPKSELPDTTLVNEIMKQLQLNGQLGQTPASNSQNKALAPQFPPTHPQ